MNVFLVFDRKGQTARPTTHHFDQLFSQTTTLYSVAATRYLDPLHHIAALGIHVPPPSSLSDSNLPALPRTPPRTCPQVGDAFPSTALSKWGIKGKTSVVYFYGADDAPSCKKENALFSETWSEFSSKGVAVVGVRNSKGAKGAAVSQKLVVDEDDEIRNLIGIPKDLFVIGGRETYVINGKGNVEMVYNDQFGPEKHVDLALAKVNELKASNGGKSSGFELPAFDLEGIKSIFQKD